MSDVAFSARDSVRAAIASGYPSMSAGSTASSVTSRSPPTRASMSPTARTSAERTPTKPSDTALTPEHSDVRSPPTPDAISADESTNHQLSTMTTSPGACADCSAHRATPASECCKTTPRHSPPQFATSPKGRKLPGWKGSQRRSRLPRDWERRRKIVLERDGYRCTAVRADTEERCNDYANQVDHIVQGADDDRIEGLTSLCEHHHSVKSSAEGGRAKAARNRATTRRHPGLVA